jgi:maltose phosphorylase
MCNPGVTGPNEYENNVNNNFYTNFIAKWCIDYTYAQLQKVSMGFRLTTNVLIEDKVAESELKEWKKVANT